ncbi:MAG TPA: DUF4290 domain-containing protein [Bacteroidales bacterium]|nr:DUF4290 domain-containing protein [Bacteroidales bacterium]HSA44263.1 DUF4290 domain-containing protein [Bacteroidales bacterium]
MEYNTRRTHLIIPEYGRNIQKMVDYAISIEDRERRTNIAKTIIQIMTQINPLVKESTDYKQKLWDHLYIISDFKLDVDSPFPMPSPEDLNQKPEKVPYGSKTFKYGYYGKNLEKIISKISEMEEGPERDSLVNVLANNMKKAYLTWNRDTVADEVIYEHLHELSAGRLKVHEETKLQHTSELLGPPKPKKKKFFPRQKDNNQRRRKK